MSNKDTQNMKKIYRFEECYAKVLLENLFPERFYQLEIADKPDLQNDSAKIGIEVTTAVKQDEKEKDHLFSMLTHNKGTLVQQNRNKDRIRKLGGQYFDEGIMFSWAGCRDLNKIYFALKSKLKKLNGGGYHLYEKQYVFITDDNIIYQNELSDILIELQRIQSNFQAHFDSIFIYLFGGTLIEFDMKDANSISIVVNNVNDLVEKAYKISNK